MMRLIVVIGVLGLSSGGAIAGGCSNSSHAKIDMEKSPVLASSVETDLELLARLKKQREEAEALEYLLDLPVAYN